MIGISGTGESTLALWLAEGLGVAHVELDALHWDSGRTPAAPEVFAASTAATMVGPAWVVEGNYSALRPVVRGRASRWLWLGYARRPAMLRVIRRSVARALSQREFWNGNREDWRSRWRASHPIRWAWNQWRGRRVSLEAVLATGTCGHLRVLRLHWPGEAPGALHALRQEGRCPSWTTPPGALNAPGPPHSF